MDLEQNCFKLFTIAGALSIGYICLKFAFKVCHALRVYAFKTYPDFSKYGKWSVVTGSTEGIGKGIACELASKGQNIILLSRTAEKLKKVADEINSKYGVEVKFLQIDFSEDESIYDKIEAFLKGLDIGVLVNNVGAMPLPEYYHNIPDLSEVIRKTTRVNVISVLKMTQLILPQMVERKRGLIINVSTGISRIPIATFNIYGASKAFIDYFTQALSYEYEDKGITVQSLLPGPVSTPGTNNPPANFMVPNAETYAKSLLSTVEKERCSFGCFAHSLQFWILYHIPLTFFNRNMAPKLREEMLKDAKKK